MSRSKDKGTRFEREFAALMGGRRVPGSGSLPGLIGDVKLPPPFDSFLWECKARAALPRIIHEALEQSRAAKANHGGLLLPAAAIKGDRSRPVVVFYADDFRDWATALSQGSGTYQLKQTLRQIERAAREAREGL